jgi:tetratricopeptide (TPR) repeat protein
VRRDSIFSHQQVETLGQIGADLENIRTAWNMLVEQHLFDELSKFLNGLWFFFHVHSRNQESVELFETAVNVLRSLPISDMTDLTLARLWAHLVWCYHDLGLSEKGLASAEAALRLFDQQDSPEDRLVAYQGLTVIHKYRWEPENMRQFAEKGYELALKLGDHYWEAHSLMIHSQIAGMTGENREIVLRRLRQATAIYENTQNSWGLVLCYSTRAGIAFGAGDYAQAKHWASQCQVLAKAFGNAFFSGSSALYLGMVALRQEDHDHAWDSLRQALRIFWEAGLVHFAPGPMVNMAQLLLHGDKPELAIDILALTERHPGYHGHGALFAIGPHRFEALRQELQARLGADRFAAAWALGEKRDLSAVVAELLSGDVAD